MALSLFSNKSRWFCIFGLNTEFAISFSIFLIRFHFWVCGLFTHNKPTAEIQQMVDGCSHKHWPFWLLGSDVQLEYGTNGSWESHILHIFPECKTNCKPIMKEDTWMENDHNPIYPAPPLGQDMTQGQFLSRVLLVWIQSFPSPRLVASPRLKNPVCPTIYP